MIRINPVSPGLALGLARGLPLILAAGLLTACMSPTPYQPRLEGQSTGYTDRALTQNRYRVTFTGNSAVNNTCPAGSGAHSFVGKKVRLVG